jgi:putative aldouronate transport system permease protein
MQNGVVKRQVDVLMTYVYDMGIQKYEVGYASAVSILVLLATLGMTAIVWTLTGFGKDNV